MTTKPSTKAKKLEELLRRARRQQPEPVELDQQWIRRIMTDIHHVSLVQKPDPRQIWPTRLLWQSAFSFGALAICLCTYALVTDLGLDLLALQAWWSEPSLDHGFAILNLITAAVL